MRRQDRHNLNFPQIRFNRVDILQVQFSEYPIHDVQPELSRERAPYAFREKCTEVVVLQRLWGSGKHDDEKRTLLGSSRSIGGLRHGIEGLG